MLGSSTASQRVMCFCPLIGWRCADALCILLQQPGQEGGEVEAQPGNHHNTGGDICCHFFYKTFFFFRWKRCFAYAQHVRSHSCYYQPVTAPSKHPQRAQRGWSAPDKVSPFYSVYTEQVKAGSMPVNDPESILSYQVKCSLNLGCTARCFEIVRDGTEQPVQTLTQG